MKTKNIQQSVVFSASPHVIYEMLMDSKKHAKFTEAPAKISKKIGGIFTAYDGYIEGKNVELVPDKKIVQTWRGNEWPEKHYSVVSFKLQQLGEKTKLIFTQKGVPEEHYNSIFKGWIEHYWEKMKKSLMERKTKLDS